MASSYSSDLRERVISHLMSGCSKREVAKVFKIGEASVYRWIELYKSGDIHAKKRTDYPRKVDEQKLRDYVAQHPDHTLKQIGQALGLAFQTVSTWLRRLKITRKKRQPSIRSAMKRNDRHLDESLRQ